MGLALKHIELTKSGRFQYRRRVPKDVVEVIGKREFRWILGATERESLAAHPFVHASVERENAEAVKTGTTKVVAARGALTEREVYEVAPACPIKLALQGTDWAPARRKPLSRPLGTQTESRHSQPEHSGISADT